MLNNNKEKAIAINTRHLPYKQGVTGSNPVVPTKALQFARLFFSTYIIMNYTTTFLLFICIFLFSCSATKSVYILTEDVNVETISSCRNSSISNFSNNPKLKSIQQQSIKEQSEVQKVKTVSNKEDAKYKIKSSKIVITEKCGQTNNSEKPSYNLAQTLAFENVDTQELIEFKSDTNIVPHQELSNINSLLAQIPSFESYIPVLTKNNISLLKSYLAKKK